MRMIIKKFAVWALVLSCAFMGACSFQRYNQPLKEIQHYRTFIAGEDVRYGHVSDSHNADLVLYMPREQFMLLEDLIKDFQSEHPAVKKIYVQTGAPNRMLKAQILQQGYINGEPASQTPDLFATADQDDIRVIEKANRLGDKEVYAGNRLALMVAENNPKHITGLKDLARDDVVISVPNPLSEDIFRLYGKEVFRHAGIYRKLVGWRICRRCWAKKDKTWFTSHYYIETPTRITKGLADAGLVWQTDIPLSKEQGFKVEGVRLEKKYSRWGFANYTLVTLNNALHNSAAKQFVAYLHSEPAQKLIRDDGFAPITQHN